MRKQDRIKRMVKAMLNRNIETKTGLYTASDGTEMAHNSAIVLSSNPLATVIGPNDPDNSIGQRIGDEINLSGMSIKYMVELNERYSDVTFRMMVVKAAKGDVPNTANLFNGVSGNKMLDTFNNERFTIIHSEYFKLKAPNQSTFGGLYSVAGSNSGINSRSDVDENLSRATTIRKVWLPGSKFGRGGHITYESGTSQLKFFDYYVLLYAYSNYSTSQAGGWLVARLNDVVIQLYYKDA